ncbi:MAG: nucleotidyltransferase [Verrucomicrobiota bacterium]
MSLCLKHEVHFLVIGGYAVVHYSRPRYTGDLDVWVDASQQNAERIVEVLIAFGFRPSEVNTKMITEMKQIIRMGIEPMRLEIFTRIPGVRFDSCYERREIVSVGGLEVPFISLTDLKVNKQQSGRPKDLQDLEELP